jgi:hypothetical protein
VISVHGDRLENTRAHHPSSEYNSANGTRPRADERQRMHFESDINVGRPREEVFDYLAHAESLVP